MNSTVGRIHSVETMGALDGPGLRYVLFLQGCEMRCKYCHNPDTWNKRGGRLATADEVMEDILKYKEFIKGGGVTLSGGEPLLQPDFCRELLRACKTYGIHCAIDTAGMISLSSSAVVIAMADLILLDIKSIDKETHKKLTGFSNSKPLKILNFCEDINKPVWIRHVLVPEYTLIKEDLEKLGEFLSGYKCIERVDLLPYHKMGEYKWENLKLNIPLKQIAEPTDEQKAFARNILTGFNLPVFVG